MLYSKDNEILSTDVYRESFKEIFTMVNRFERLLAITKANMNEKRKYFLEEQWHDLRLSENENYF